MSDSQPLSANKRNTSIELLAPVVKSAAIDALAEANAAGYPVKAYETYRSPERQEYLYAQGRSQPGAVVTRAKAWQSFHQYSCALDVVFWLNNAWSWDKSLPWDKVAGIFAAHGFERLDFEKPHFEITGGYSWKQAHDIVRKQSMQAFWLLVERSHNATFPKQLFAR